jgi:NADPH-ferrihemoprotein reductase
MSAAASKIEKKYPAVIEMPAQFCYLIRSCATTYIYSKASMATEVGAIIEAITSSIQQISGTEIKDWVDGLKRRGTWKADVWG